MGFFSALFGGKKEKTPEEIEKEKEKNFDILKFDGLKAQRMNQLAYSVKCFTQALALKEDYNTRMYLAQSYVHLQEHKLAFEQLQILIENDPENIEAYILTAHVAEQMQNWQAMNDACQKAFLIDDNRSDVHYMYAKACLGLEDVVTAVAMLTKALTIDDTFQPAYSMRYDILMQMGQFQDAEKDADKLIEMNPENETFVLYKAYSLQGQRKIDEAINCYKKVRELNALCSQAYLGEGFLLTHSGKLDEAIQIYTEAIEVNPLFADAFKERGKVKLMKGDKAGATEDMKQALELAPEEAGKINGEFSNVEREMDAKSKGTQGFKLTNRF